MVENRYIKNSQLEGCICDIVTYTAEYEGYTTLSYMNELAAIRKKEYKERWNQQLLLR